MKNRTLVFSSALLVSTLASANAQSWTSLVGGNWSAGLNWSTTPTAPANDGSADIIFNSNPAALTSAIDAAYSINSLTYGTAVGPFTISGSALTLGAGGITNNGAPSGTQTQVISAPITIGVSQQWNPGTQNGVNRHVNITGAITGTSDKVITVSGSQGDALYRRFSISGNNTATLASNWEVGVGGRLALASSATANFGTGTVTVNTGGMVGGEGGSSAIASNIILAGGTLGALGDGVGGNFNGSINITADSLINLTRGSGGTGLSAANTAGSIITGNGNLTQTTDVSPSTKTTSIGNTGSTTANTNTGTLTINAGIVLLQKADNTTAWGGNIVINTGGFLRYNSFRENQIGDASTVTINAGGTWNLEHGIAGNASNQQVHEKIAGLIINTAASAFINDFSNPDGFAGTPLKARILLGSGTSATGTADGIFVNSTGSLSGIGTVNKATIVQGGSLSPGNVDTTVGTLTFSSGLTLGTGLAAGSLAYELGAPTTAGTDYDTVATNTLELGAGLLNISSFQFTGSPAVGTYTLVSSTAPITGSLGATVSGPVGAFTGTLSISGGNSLVLTVSSGSLSAYDDWADNFPGFTPTTPALDFESDGISNLLEFVLGGNPKTNDSPSIRPSVTAPGLDLVVTFRRSDASQLQPVAVKVQISTDLSTWNPADEITIGATNGSGPNGATYTVAEGPGVDGIDTIVVTIPKAAATKKFARVVATQ